MSKNSKYLFLLRSTKTAIFTNYLNIIFAFIYYTSSSSETFTLKFEGVSMKNNRFAHRVHAKQFYFIFKTIFKLCSLKIILQKKLLGNFPNNYSANKL